MPHLICEYSEGLEAQADLAALGRDLHAAMAATDVFPLAGIRVRFHRCALAFVGDLDSDNSFLAMELRVGAGRDEETLRAAGAAVFAVAERALGGLISARHTMLSLEIRETHPFLTWKANKIHARLEG